MPNHLSTLLDTFIMTQKCLFIFCLMLFLGCKKPADSGSPASTETNTPAVNPFGALINDGSGVSLSTTAKAAITKDSLKAKYARTAIVLQTFTGSSANYETYAGTGLNVILNMNWGVASSTGNAVAFPTDMVDYSAKFNAVINKYQPELAVIENEEINEGYHAGPLTDYLTELQTAVNLCHAKGLKATNGGIVERVVTLLVWNDYYSRGLLTEASSYAARAFPAQMLDAQGNPNVKGNAKLADALAKGQQLISAYKAMNLDFVNFHWYEPVAQREVMYQTANLAAIAHIDPKTLEESVAYLAKATGKTVIINEVGQLNQQPGIVTDVMQKLSDLKMPYVIWYSGDSGTGLAVALQNANGSLRANGIAFRNFKK